jgi:2'-5' RNA ligase
VNAYGLGGGMCSSLRKRIDIVICRGGVSRNTRTIMIFPEFENINVINNIRKKYDPLADLVLPHITLVFPFDSELTNEELNLYLKECLRDIHQFKVELEGFGKQEDRYGNYLFLNVAQGMDVIKNIHAILYKDKLKQFDAGYDYVPHMTVGKVSSMELLDKAFDDVNKCNDKFITVVKKISVEMIGEHEESIIAIEYELN